MPRPLRESSKSDSPMEKRMPILTW
jgi:hypothetical protein